MTERDQREEQFHQAFLAEFNRRERRAIEQAMRKDIPFPADVHDRMTALVAQYPDLHDPAD